MTLNAAETEVMSDEISGPGYAAPDPAQENVSRSFLRQAMIDTFSRFGARLGALWICILVTGAVFAPFIASSFPLLVKERMQRINPQGATEVYTEWSSPLMHYITPTDVMLLVAFFSTAALLIRRRVPFSTGVAGVAWLLAVALPFTLWPSVVKDHWMPAPERMKNLGRVLLVMIALADLMTIVSLAVFTKTDNRTLRNFGIAGLLIALALCSFPIRPGQNPIYETYREGNAAGKYEKVVHTIVAFSPNDYQRDDSDARLQPPSLKHWMGTEGSGADVFSRMLHASRIALSIGFIATGISVLIGVTVGGFMGYFSGAVDIIGMRFIEMIEAVPTLILLLTVCAFFGVNLYLMMTIIGLFSWTGNARFVRAEFFRLRKQDFVQAAIANGLPLRSVIFRHMLPNGLTPVLVNMSFGVAGAILYESTLSFLGLGLVDEPSWGQLLNQARAGGAGFQWWIATFPGLAIFLTVFAYNLIGESMRDALDPKLRKRD